jgi:predicted dehydrogenase
VKFLVIGLGSMGKRRIRNLLALGYFSIAGVDIRDDRRIEALDKYKIQTFSDFDLALQEFNPDVLIISTPPDQHMHYAYLGFYKGISSFIEASVVHMEDIQNLEYLTRNSGVMILPSCTMRYYPGPRKIKELVQSGNIGKILNVNYQTGQYLPDWHPWENIEDFYVSHRDTGAARELVPFELTWLNDIFGTPFPISCYKSKLTDMSAEIDDIYHILLSYENGQVLANITIEVISRPIAVREMRILGSHGEITFSGEHNKVRCIKLGMNEWEEFDLNPGTQEAGYINPEEPYIAEMKDFIAAITTGNESLFPNSLMDDYDVLQILNSLEDLSERNL